MQDARVIDAPLRVVIALDSGGVACATGSLRSRDSGPWHDQAVSHELELLECGWAAHPSSPAASPDDPTVLAQVIEQALDEMKARALPDRALVSLSHPALRHRRVTAQIDLAEEPVTIRRQTLERLKAQALSQALALDEEPLLLEALGYTGSGFEAVRDPRGLVAARLSGTFHLVSMPVAVRRIVSQALETVGLELEQLVYRLKALAALASEWTEDSSRLLLVDLGGRCTECAVVDQQLLIRSETIPEGLRSFAAAVAQECRMTVEEALAASLEGRQSRRPPVRRLLDSRLRIIHKGLQQVLKDGPLPARAVVTGEGALMDGMVEWVEEVTTIPSVLGRSRLAQACGPLARQVACTAAIGLLELIRRSQSSPAALPSGFLERVLARTRTILTEYF